MEGSIPSSGKADLSREIVRWLKEDLKRKDQPGCRREQRDFVPSSTEETKQEELQVEGQKLKAESRVEEGAAFGSRRELPGASERERWSQQAGGG